jgi:hypothetical protein
MLRLAELLAVDPNQTSGRGVSNGAAVSKTTPICVLFSSIAARLPE